MEDLTPNEVARLHLKARHGTLTPEEQQVYSDYMARQLASAQLPSDGTPPKRSKPKRNIDIPNVLGKIAGVALVVAALVILGPPIARYGLELVDGLFDARDSITAQIEAVQSPSVEYYNRGGDSVYVCGDRMVWVDTWSEASHIDDRYWVCPVTSYVTAGMPMTITQYYECDRDGNIVSGPYETEADVPAPDGWIDASSEVYDIKILEKGAHGWEYRGRLSGQALAQWLSDNGLADGSTKEQVISCIRYDYDGYEPMTGAYSPEADTAGVAGAKPILFRAPMAVASRPSRTLVTARF